MSIPASRMKYHLSKLVLSVRVSFWFKREWSKCTAKAAKKNLSLYLMKEAIWEKLVSCVELKTNTSLS